MDRIPETCEAVVLQALCGLSAFAFGAALGSFLNVVAHRVPLGRSPVGGRSHCPSCGVQILARDNVPVVSWLLLRGRCRACRGAISPRYAIVEAACGGVFLLLCILEVVAGGWNLPGRLASGLPPASWTPLDADWTLVATCCYHAVALGMLLVWAVIDTDGHAVPSRLILATLLVAAAAPAVVPAIHPLPVGHWILEQGEGNARPPAASPPPVDRLDRGLAVSVAGAAAGGAAGCLAARLLGASSSSLVAAFALVGIVFGWQAVVGVCVVMAVAMAVLTAGRRLSPAKADGPRSSVAVAPIALFAIAAVVHLLGWRWIDGLLAALLSNLSSAAAVG